MVFINSKNQWLFEESENVAIINLKTDYKTSISLGSVYE